MARNVALYLAFSLASVLAGALEESKAVQDLLEANGGYFPENAGPVIRAAK